MRLENELQNEGIYFLMKAQIMKMIYLWIVLPFFVIITLRYTVCTFLSYKVPSSYSVKTSTSFSLAMYLLMFLILIVSGFRMTIFYFLEYADERKIKDIYIMQAHDYFTSTTYKFYKPLNVYLGEYISNWNNFEVLIRLREKYGSNIKQLSLNSYEQTLHSDTGEFTFTFSISEEQNVDDIYYSSLAKQYVHFFLKDIPIDFEYDESNRILRLYATQGNIDDMISQFEKEILSFDDVDVDDFIKYIPTIYKDIPDTSMLR